MLVWNDNAMIQYGSRLNCGECHTNPPGTKDNDVANIKDVARYANVSPTTVSHVLNDRGRVAPKTRERVLEVAAQLGYTANPHAQQLVTRRSRILAIQMPDLDGAGPGVALLPTSESEYFLELINGAAAAAADANYALIIVSAGVDASSMRGFGADGMIIVDPRAPNRCCDRLSRQSVPSSRPANPSSTLTQRDSSSTTITAPRPAKRLITSWPRGVRGRRSSSTRHRVPISATSCRPTRTGASTTPYNRRSLLCRTRRLPKWVGLSPPYAKARYRPTPFTQAPTNARSRCSTPREPLEWPCRTTWLWRARWTVPFFASRIHR